MNNIFSFLVNNRKAQGIIEYALILVLIAMVVIVVLSIFGDALNTAYCDIITQIGGDGGTACATP